MWSYRLSLLAIFVFLLSATAKSADIKENEKPGDAFKSIFKEVNGEFGFINVPPSHIPGVQSGQPVHYPLGYPQIYIHWYPGSNPQGFPQWYPNGNPQGGPQGFPQGGPQGFPQGGPQGIPQGPQDKPQGGPPEYIPDETESFDPSVGPRIENPAEIDLHEIEDMNDDFSGSNDLEMD